MISVVIPTYKNKDKFLSNLKHNSRYLNGCEIIIVNDNPNSSLTKDLNGYQSIQLYENTVNLGFGLAVNLGVQKARHKLVMLLNDDVILNDDKFKNHEDKFKKNKKLFAITFAQQEKDGSIVGHNQIFWKKGLFFHKKSVLKSNINAWAEGGSCIVDREKFLNLKGFDPIYSPFYWEDIDLSYRAWKNGYELIYDPNTVVKHHHQTTIGQFYNPDTISVIAFRNQFLFIWKNISDRAFIASHLALLIPNIIYYLLAGQKNFLIGLFAAIKKIFQIQRNNYKISDKIILDKFKHE